MQLLESSTLRKVRNPFRPRVRVTDRSLKKQSEADIVARALQAISGTAGQKTFLEAMLNAFILGAERSGASREAILTQAEPWLIKQAEQSVPKILDTTRQAVNAKIDAASRAGLTPAEFQEQLQDSFAFSRDRALMVSRTSGAIAANVGEAEGWRVDGIEFVEIIDGTGDAACRHANGLKVEIAEYLRHPIAHPNCERTAKPLFERPSQVGTFRDER